MIKFKCSNCFITYSSILLQFWNFMKTLKFLKLFENFIILNFFQILLNFWKFWNFKKIWNLKKNVSFNFFFFNFIILNFFENFQILWNFLTYWLAKSNFCAIKKTYCTLVPRNFIHWNCTRVQYDYLLHRNCFLLINMLENGMSRVLLLANRKTVK